MTPESEKFVAFLHLHQSIYHGEQCREDPCNHAHQLQDIEAAAATRERQRLNDRHTRFCPTCTCNATSDPATEGHAVAWIQGADAERERITAALPDALAEALMSTNLPVPASNPQEDADAYLAHPAVRAILEPEVTA